MKKKFLGRVLTMLLVASMVFTLLPASAIAAGNWWWDNEEYTEEAVPAATADNYSRILHLDCGRKYFSKNWIIALLHEMQDAGYNQLELAFGNDGLRFLLNDMTFVANETTYDHATIVQKVEAGNELQNSSNDSRWLTETEMNEIIATANGLGIEIVPLLNLPGHANTILDIADDTLNASGSNNTLDVANSEAARNFGMAIFEKYLEYFNGKGCHYFCFGADEYANDAGTPFSFSRLNTVQYANFASFINTLSEKIDAKGMTPRAFNDGLYYNRGEWDMNTSVNNNIPKIQCCYWSSGWGDYPVASASTIANKGHKMINTHGDWYYVTKTDKNGNAVIQIPSDSAIRGFSNTAFSGSTINNPVGSMFCIWCDAPAIRTEQEIAGNIRLLLRKMAARMQDKSIDTINTGIVTGGFNEDGTLNKPDTGITITPEGGTTGTTGAPKLDIANSETLTLTASEKVLWRWNSEVVNLTSADPAEEISTVDAYALQELQAKSVFVTPIAAGDPMVEVTTLGENPTTTKYPIEVVNSAATTGVTVELKVGDDKTVPVEGHNYANNVNKAELKEDIATVTVTGKDAYKTDPTYKSEDDVALSTIADGVGSSWEKTKYWYKPSTSNGEYYPVYAKKESLIFPTYYVGYSKTDNADDVTEERKQGFFESTKKLNVYTRTEGVDKPASTTITFHGVAEGTTHVTIGGTKYTIKVSYYEQPVNVVLNQSTEVAVSGKLNADGLNTAVAEVSISTDGTTMTVNGKAEGNTSVIVGNTKYNITVSKENLENVTPLKIEYWITNGRVVETGTTTTEKEIAATSVNSEKGLAITELVPHEGRKQDDDNANMLFWKATRLTKGNEQTDTDGVDQTMKGDDFSFIHYWNSQWEFSADGTSWTAFNKDDQVVAYYMQVTKVTSEVTTTVVDWGPSKDRFGELGYLGGQFVLLDFAVKYESGDLSPATFPTNNTIGFHCENMSQRTLGRINALPTDEYEVYMITLTPSSDDTTVVLSTINAATAASKPYTYDGTEKVVWVDKEENLGKFTDEALKHANFAVGGEATLAQGVTIYKGQGLLVTYYLRTKGTEDSLTVNYVNQTTGEQFYSYNIAVASGTVFKSDIGLKNPAEQELLNGDVVNIKGVTQNVTADLIKMPGVPAQYRYSKYQCKELARNNDKTITLYYTFNNSVGFVVDFGRPLTIAPKDVNEKLALSGVTIDSVKVENVTYGTCSIDGTNFTFTYTPGKDFASSGSGEALTVKYTGRILNEETNEIQQSTVAYQVYIYPASNVLYEASFLTQVSKDNGPVWTLTPAATKTQQTQKVGDTTTNYHVFGRDTAYDDAYGALGAWQLGSEQNPLQPNKVYSTLKTEFYGNGFDLIGNCGQTTGRVLLVVKPETGNGKIIDIDTRYSGETLYQVPLAHVNLGDIDAKYSVTILASGLAATTVNTAKNARIATAAVYAEDSKDTLLMQVLAENGLTMADVEYVKVESAPAAAKTARRAASFYALDTAAETGTVTHAPGTHVEIDGFRVYRSTNNTNYPESEQNVQYLNILDAVSSFTAFVEGSTADREWTAREQYENAGGPQNEIYLRKTDGTGNAIAFNVDPNASVQISARAVENGKAATLVVNGETIVIATNTEMYYTVKANERGIVTIKNTGEGMLALGNLKIKNGTQTAALSEEDYPAAIALLSLNAAPETPDTVFEPEISAKVTTTKFIRSKVVTLTVSASADVAKLTVNGTELRPTNGWLVSMGWSKSYNYILTETMKKSETRTYEIIGYSADGTPSTPTVVKSK